MNKKDIAFRLKEDTKYQEFFRNALKKFGEKTPAEMSDDEKSKFFTYIEKNWTDEDPATDDGDVVDEGGTGKIRNMTTGSKRKNQQYKGQADSDASFKGKNKKEEQLRSAIRKEIASALSGDTLEEDVVEEGKNIYHFKNMIRGGMINVSLANDKAASKYADRLGSRWQLVNIGEAIEYLRELQELAERKACKKK